MIRITSNKAKVERQMRSVEPAVTRGTRSAINKMAAQSLTLTLRELSTLTGLPQRKLREYVFLRRAQGQDLYASVRINAHTFNIASLPGTRQLKGIKARFIYTKGGKRHTTTASRRTGGGVSSVAWGTRKTYPHTFLIQGGKTAMVRIGKHRLPIRPVHGPRITREFTRGGVDTELTAQVSAKMPDLVRHEIDFALGRIGLAAR